MSFKRYNKSIKRHIFCFDFRSNFLVSISFLINIGKEMSLPGFRTNMGSISNFSYTYLEALLKNRDHTGQSRLYVPEIQTFLSE